MTAAHDGFVENVYTKHLLNVADGADAIIELVVQPGDHVIEGEPLARLEMPDQPDADADADASLLKAIRDGISLASTRSPTQDIRFSLALLTEMAVRALSPGTNDPYTANNAIAELGSGLVRLAHRPQVLPGRAKDGRLRVIVPVISREELLDDVFTDLRVHGASEPTVVRSTLQLAGRIARCRNEPMAIRAREHGARMLHAFQRGDPHPYDLDRMRQIARQEFGDDEFGDADRGDAGP